MKCPCCRVERMGEYFHVLSVDMKYGFNYCCTDCLAEHIARHVLKKIIYQIKFKLSDEDKAEIQKMINVSLASTYKPKWGPEHDKIMAEHKKAVAEGKEKEVVWIPRD